MSNRASAPNAGSSVQPVLHIILSAEIQRHPTNWQPSTFLLRLLSDGTADLSELIYPQGVTNVQIKTININGVVAAIGNNEEGNYRAFLLFPLGIIEGDSNNSSRPIAIPSDIEGPNHRPVNTLAVAKMEDVGVLTGNGSTANLDVDKDSDRFYIRISGGANSGITSVKVQTENVNTAYNNVPVELDLSVDGKDLISKSLMLTSDSVDDQQRVDGIVDNAKNDRTYKVELGGKLVVLSVSIGNKTFPASFSVPVPVKKTVYVTPIIVRSFAGRPAETTSEQAEAQLNIARERFAQVGVRLEWAPVTTVDPPPNANLYNGLVMSENDSGDPAATVALTDKAKLVISTFGTIDNSKDIRVLWVGSVTTHFNGDDLPEGGYAVAQFHFSPADVNYCNNCFISAGQGPFVVAHELGHLLINSGHVGDRINLMWGEDQSNTNTIMSHKRLNSTQATAIMSNNIGVR